MPFVVATPARTVCDDNARVLSRAGMLRCIALGTRRGTAGVPPDQTRLNPAIGAVAYIAAKTLPLYYAEALRFRLLPWFDRWVAGLLEPGDHILSSYGYVNDCFRRVRRAGGKTFLDAGNSHPEHYWRIVSEEHERWGVKKPPFTPFWRDRSMEMMADVDYVLSPSEHVDRTFLERGFQPGQLLRNVYPLDLSIFTPAKTGRPKERPLTLICTGSVSLRKGIPYLLDAYRAVRKQVPDARLLLTSVVSESAQGILAANRDLPVEWAPALPHSELADRLRSADIFVMPSLEEGFCRTVTEAMGCGLPAVVTDNTGAADVITHRSTGSVVPIRDVAPLAEEILWWWEQIRSGWRMSDDGFRQKVSYELFSATFLGHLEAIGV